MQNRLPNDIRDTCITAFRQRLCAQLEIIPFFHQASWWAAADGRVLLDTEAPDGTAVRLPDDRVVTLESVDRPYGRAKVIADLGSFKIGKSYGAAVWVAGFACIPNARVQLIGLEYDVCAPEFEYLVELLLSERGLNLKADTVQNRPRDGRMWIDLPNGARFEAKSWDRKDTLKGKEIDCYLYCEAYMLPGLECYTDYSQNLRARDGYAVFPTTPDRPWLKDIHNAAHSSDPNFAKWHCTCGVSAEANPRTFNQADKDRDRELMTREKFAIHYDGQLGDFQGRVYGYQRGQKVFTALTHPFLFRPGGDGGRHSFILPDGWVLEGGADTGTMFSGVFAAVAPNGFCFVIDEFPNYSYIAGQIELSNETFGEWCGRVYDRWRALTARPLVSLWADKNSQFKREAANQRDYHLTLRANNVNLEVRTEISRSYFQHDKILLAPWLTVLPFELENAQWPEGTSPSGAFARVKDRDHTLDGLEHILSRHPRAKGISTLPSKKSWIECFVGTAAFKRKRQRVDPHLGAQ